MLDTFMKGSNFLFTIVLFFISSSLIGQYRSFSPEIGFGNFGYNFRDVFHQHRGELILDGTDFILGSGMNFSKGKESLLSFQTGLFFNKSEAHERSFSTMMIPSNLGFKTRGKLKFYASTGFDVQVLIAHSGWENDQSYKISNRSLMLSFNGKLGAEWQMDNEQSIGVYAKYREGISSIYVRYFYTVEGLGEKASEIIGVSTSFHVYYVIPFETLKKKDL